MHAVGGQRGSPRRSPGGIELGRKAGEAEIEYGAGLADPAECRSWLADYAAVNFFVVFCCDMDVD